MKLGDDPGLSGVGRRGSLVMGSRELSPAGDGRDEQKKKSD